MDTEDSIKGYAIPEKDRWENLRITNDFMFYKVMSDKDTSQENPVLFQHGGFATD